MWSGGLIRFHGVTHRALLAGAVAASALSPVMAGEAPYLLSETGLYVPGSVSEVSPQVHTFTPQYPLWSDGANKRRWIYLPAGAQIDASRPDAWEFPVGTKLWKEFSHARRIETRFIQRLADGSWRFAVYVWREDGRDATLAPARGIRVLPVQGAPDGNYVIPSQDDCRACHEGAAVPVLGFTALQLSPDRDPNAVHGEPQATTDLDLPQLARRGLLRHFPRAYLERPPRISAASADARAALGYLHSNCGHCHNDPGDSAAGVPVELLFAQYIARSDASRAVWHSLKSLESTDVLLHRMRTRDPRVQMPPLGTRIPDTAALAVIERWINHQPNLNKEHTP